MKTGILTETCDKAIAKALDQSVKDNDPEAEKQLKALTQHYRRNPKRIESLREKAPVKHIELQAPKV